MSAHGLAQNWWLIALRGLFAVLFGLAALAWPNPTLAALVLLFGVYLLADGLLAVIAGLTRHNGSQPWGLLLIEGSAGILAGVLTFLLPGLTAIALLYLIAAWAITTGMVKMVSAIRLRAEIDNEGLLAMSSVLSATLGVVLMIWPGPGALGLIWVVGAYALVSGFLLIGFGFRLWNWQSSAHLALHPARVEVGRHPHPPQKK
ncbi:MAG: HdeD family acid-resistance protein [Chloroflexota bacterium]